MTPAHKDVNMTTPQQNKKFISEVVRVYTNYFKEVVQNSKTDAERRAQLKALNICIARPVSSISTRRAAVKLSIRAGTKLAQGSSRNMKAEAKLRHKDEGCNDAHPQCECQC